MVRSSGFGSTSRNYVALFRLAFASAPALNALTSLRNVTRRPVLQKVRHHALLRKAVALCLLVSIGFQVLFHSPPGVLFTFPSRYYTLSVTRRWSSCLPTGFLVSCGTPDPARLARVSVTRLSLSLVRLSLRFTYARSCFPRSFTPSHISMIGLGSFPFAHHYSGNR